VFLIIVIASGIFAAIDCDWPPVMNCHCRIDRLKEYLHSAFGLGNGQANCSGKPGAMARPSREI
jgi:hypothetical protein